MAFVTKSYRIGNGTWGFLPRASWIEPLSRFVAKGATLVQLDGHSAYKVDVMCDFDERGSLQPAVLWIDQQTFFLAKVRSGGIVETFKPAIVDEPIPDSIFSPIPASKLGPDEDLVDKQKSEVQPIGASK